MTFKLPFTTADILLPKTGFESWACIACDQYTSQRDYWARAYAAAGDAPSALNIVLPEVYLEDGDKEARIASINAKMREYLDGGVFNEYEDALIYVERRLADGRVRRGLVGAFDLAEYAYEQGIHPAVISYLELRRKNFYRMENTVDGRIFATARGWEDLSRLIQVYETLNKEVDREVVYQYIQHPMVAKDFASYLALYNKYKTDYAVEDLLQGKWTPITLGKIRNASLDEHLSIVGLLNGKLSQLFADCYFMDAYVTKLYGYMTEYRDNLPEMTLESIYKKAENDFHTAKKSELLTKNEEKVFIRTVNFFENEISEKATYEKAKTAFAEVADSLETQTEYISQTLQNVFDFMEAAFGDSQEMVAFITELNANYYSLWFIRENGSDQYYRHNKGLLFDNRQKQILGQMEELEQGNNFPSVLK